MKKTMNTCVLGGSGETTPQAWVALKRNRQKIYNGQGNSKVYLKDGQEFQIELFNPTSTKYLVKFKLNGKYQSQTGLILNPGQRYFLDRFIDEERKMTFSTYEVENTKQVKKAIEDNGLLEVEFYAEQVWQSTGTYIPLNLWNGNNYWYGGSTTTGSLTLNSSTSTFTVGSSNANYVSTNTSSGDFINASLSANSSIETGRVEKGEKSDQFFEEGFGSFNSWVSYTTKLQILPTSQKPVETQEIRSYCTGCGSRIKKQTWKFCPNCGTAAE
jgi:hypothetical protein